MSWQGLQGSWTLTLSCFWYPTLWSSSPQRPSPTAADSFLWGPQSASSSLALLHLSPPSLFKSPALMLQIRPPSSLASRGYSLLSGSLSAALGPEHLAQVGTPGRTGPQSEPCAPPWPVLSAPSPSPPGQLSLVEECSGLGSDASCSQSHGTSLSGFTSAPPPGWREHESRGKWDQPGSPRWGLAENTAKTWNKWMG